LNRILTKYAYIFIQACNKVQPGDEDDGTGVGIGLMNWAEIYDKLVQFATERIWILMVFCISSGFIIFAPEKWLSVLKLSVLSMSVKVPIGLMFVFSFCLLFVRGVIYMNEKRISALRKSKKLALLRKLEVINEKLRDNNLSPNTILSWASETSPYLKFNSDIYGSFSREADNLKFFAGQKHTDMFKSILNKMKIDLQRAIDELKFDVNEK